MAFYFSENLPNTLIMEPHQHDAYGNGLAAAWAIPMVGNAQYGWNRRRIVFCYPKQLEPAGSAHMQRLVAAAQGVPEEYLP